MGGVGSGRISEYSADHLVKAMAYLDHWSDDGDVIPTIEALALWLHVSRETVYAWARDPEKTFFSDTVSTLQSMQGKTVLNKGVKGEFNAVISKLILSAKHEYREKSEQDITSAGEALGVVVLPQKEKPE